MVLFVLIYGSLGSEFIIYRPFVARSNILRVENVHRFYQITGAILIVFGVLIEEIVKALIAYDIHINLFELDSMFEKSHRRTIKVNGDSIGLVAQ